MLPKIKYTCKNCGWSRQIPAQWADLKPRRCGNPKCNTSFILDKDKLDIERPKKAKPVKPKQETKSEEVKPSYKSKRSSKAKQQSFKKEAEDSK